MPPTLIQTLTANRAARLGELRTLLELPTSEARDLNEAEATALAAARADIDALDARIQELAEIEQRDAEHTTRMRELGIAEHVEVRAEALTYSRANPQSSYFRDLGLAHVGGDQEAAQRLARHRDEMNVEMPKREARLEARARQLADSPEFRDRRSGRGLEFRVNPNRTDGQGGEFVPPLWLLDEYAAFARAGRVFVDQARQIPLPAGTDSINIPRITGGTAVAAQTADAAAVASTDLTTATVTAPVRTIAGQQDVGLQLLEQSPLMFDEIVFADLAGDYAAKLDVQGINGTGLNGQVLGAMGVSGINAITYTDGSPTMPELYPKGADAVQQVCTNRKLPPSAWFMHPRRWFWMSSSLDSANRPLVTPVSQNPYNALAVGNDVLAEGPVGFWHGLPVWIDPNFPTTQGAGTEDEILCARFLDYLLFEGSLRTRALPEVLSGTLQVRLQLYAYVAFTAGRFPTATSAIAGTGLIAPTF